MSQTAGVEPPVLGVGPEQRVAWTQFVLALAQILAMRRQQLGVLARFEPEDAARRSDLLAELAAPSVRSMTEQEASAFRASLRGDPGSGRPANPGQDTRAVVTDAAGVRVTIAPLSDSGSPQAWGLHAHGWAEDGEAVGPVEVWCRDQATATREADALLRRGHGGIEALQQSARLAAEQARAAAQDLVEPEAVRLARTAATIRETWAAHGDLAERVIEASARHAAAGYARNPAFDALAWRLHQCEERGYAMADVLSQIDVARLREADVRNPAALAEFMVETLMGDLPVINLDDLASPAASRGGTGGGGDGGSERPGAGETDPRGAQAEAVVAPLLAEALADGEVLAAVRQAPRYRMLRDDLAAAIAAGHPVQQWLTDLPTAQIGAANDPAAYLAAILRSREGRAAPRRTLVNKAAMADLVDAHVPRAIADKIVASRSWPGLATRLADWHGRGLPVEKILAELPLNYVDLARDPAAYTARLLEKRLAAREPEAAAAADAGTARADVVDATTSFEQTVEADQVEQTLRTEQRYAGQSRQQLDAVRERVAAELQEAVAAGRPARSLRRELGELDNHIRRLDDRGARPTGRTPSGTVTPVPAAPVSALGAPAGPAPAPASSSLSVDGPTSPQQEPGTIPRPVAEPGAVGERARAAERDGSPAAAPLRAEVTVTAEPGTPQAPTSGASVRAPRQPGPVVTPEQQVRRAR